TRRSSDLPARLRGGHGLRGEAIMIPLTIDGLVYAASMVILHSARVEVKAPPLAWMLLWLGITSTLAANVAHGWQNGLVCCIVAAWIGVTLDGRYERLMWLIRTNRETNAEGPGERLDIDQIDIRVYGGRMCIGSPFSGRRIAEKHGRPRHCSRSIIGRAAEWEEP